MSDPKHSPFPWRKETEEPFCPELLDANGNRVDGIKLWEDDADFSGGDLNDTNRANFDALLTRVNAHDELLTQLKAIFRLAGTEGGDVEGETDWEAVRLAIAKAEGKS